MMCQRHLKEAHQGAKEIIRLDREWGENRKEHISYWQERIKHNFSGWDCTERDGLLTRKEWNALPDHRLCPRSQGLPFPFDTLDEYSHHFYGMSWADYEQSQVGKYGAQDEDRQKAHFTLLLAEYIGES